MAFIHMTQADKDNMYRPLDDEFLHSAAIIDTNGREVAITPEMIDQACDKLAQEFEQFQHSPRKKS